MFSPADIEDPPPRRLRTLDQQIAQLLRHRDHRGVSGRQLLVAPSFLRSCSLCERTEDVRKRRVIRAHDVGVRQSLGGLTRKPHGIFEGLERVKNEFRSKPAGIPFIGDAEDLDGVWWYAYPFALDLGRFSEVLSSLAASDRTSPGRLVVARHPDTPDGRASPPQPPQPR
jgi:hypothetical protein